MDIPRMCGEWYKRIIFKRLSCMFKKLIRFVPTYMSNMNVGYTNEYAKNLNNLLF